LEVLGGCFAMVAAAVTLLIIFGWVAALKSSSEFDKANNFSNAQATQSSAETTPAPTPEVKSNDPVDILKELAEKNFDDLSYLSSGEPKFIPTVEISDAKMVSRVVPSIFFAQPGNSKQDFEGDYLSRKGKWATVTVMTYESVSHVMLSAKLFFSAVSDDRRLDDIDGYCIQGAGNLVDRYGHPSKQIVYVIKMKSETIRKINWGLFDKKNLYGILKEEGCAVFHPAIKRDQ